MHLNAKIFKVGVPAVLGVALLYVAGCGISFNATKQGFVPPEVSAEATEKDRALIMATGVTYALEQELDSVYGWITNDLCFVPNLVDNRSAYQEGVIYATRPASDMVAKTVARVGERDTIDPRLADATSRYFTYGDNVWGFWFIYDCEGKYRAGIKGWQDWADHVGEQGRTGAIYNVKSDDVYQILRYCQHMTDYALGILNDTDMGHFRTDNNIYFAKGVAAVTANVLRAIAAVDNSVAERGGAENLTEALRRFDYIQEFNPLYTLAGGNAVGDAMVPNHVAALARHFDVASNRIHDMLASMEK